MLVSTSNETKTDRPCCFSFIRCCLHDGHVCILFHNKNVNYEKNWHPLKVVYRIILILIPYNVILNVLKTFFCQHFVFIMALPNAYLTIYMLNVVCFSFRIRF